MAATDDEEEERLRSVALRNAQSILLERRRAEDALRKQSEWLRVTLSSIGDAVISTDAEGRVSFMNSVAVSLTGWTEAEALGRPLPEVFDIVDEQSRQPAENPALRALREGKFVALTNHTVLIARDGSERQIDDSAAPIHDDQGHVFGCVLIFRDFTERRNAERQLRESEHRLRFVLDSAPQKIFTANRNGDVDYFNPQWTEFTGLPFEQIRKWGWTQFIHPDDVAENVRVWQHSIDTGEPFQFEHRFRRTDGEYRWHLSRAVPMRDAEGTVLLWVGSNTDVHEVKEADRRKNEFLAMLAHELRNPLAPIRNALEVLNLQGGNAKACRSATEMIERQVGQMVRLVDDLLDVSRISRGRIELRKERIELASAVNHAVEAFRPQCKVMEHELTVSLPAQPVYLNADPTRLVQVIGNLLSNASKFTDVGGRIALTVTCEGPQTVIAVRDSGIGIGADQIPRIFEMFMQVDTSLERSAGGLGIGLTLVKNLVEMHGGSVQVLSAGLGLGSEFVVRLPLLEASMKSPPLASIAGEPGSAIPRRILIVDDNRDSATSLALLLKLTGSETHTASDGLEAVEAAASYRPDMVLLDIGLPKLNGYEAARRIRSHPWGVDMFLVALTGWGQAEDRRKSREAGFDAHLVKPVDLAALSNLLSETGARRTLSDN